MPWQTSAAPPAPNSSTTNSVPRSRWRAVLYSPQWMVVIAFAVRVLWIALAHTYRIRTTENNFGFGWEIGRIAYALAHGMGFSSPFGGNTGPSAWTAPIYPWIVSLAFRAFGSYSPAAAFALLTFNSLFAALTCWTIYRIAVRVFNPTVAGRLDLGVVSRHHLLVGEVDLGDEPVSVPAEPALHADLGDGRR
jgi:hypothetical protein